MKFSVRNLLLVTVIVAILVAWWVDRSRMASREEHWRREADNLESELQKAGEIVVVKVPGGTRRFPLRTPRP